MNNENQSPKDITALVWLVFFLILALIGFGGWIESNFIKGLLIGNMVLCLIVAFIGQRRRIGFTGAFFLSLFASPLVGLIVSFMTPSIEDLQYKEDMMAIAQENLQVDPLDQLMKLNELRKDGGLTQEEYDMEKARILGQG